MAASRGRVLDESNLKDVLRHLRQDSPIDLVCFTGDVADWGLKEEYRAATKRISEMLDVCGVPRERLFVVPGNHDIHRATARDAWEKIRELSLKQPDPVSRWMAGIEVPYGADARWRDAVALRSDAFWRWVQHDLGRAELLPAQNPHGLLGYRATVQLQHLPFPVHIIGLDSAWLAGDDHDAGKLRLTDGQISLLCREEGKQLQGYRLAITHHPLGDLADDQVTKNRLFDTVDTLLHGHQHDPITARYWDPDRSLPILAAGCLHEGEHGDRWINGFQVIDASLDANGHPVRYEIQFWAWSSRGHWHRSGAMYESAPDGKLAIDLTDHRRAPGRLSDRASEPPTQLSRFLAPEQHGSGLDITLRDTWVARPLVTALLLLATLIYLAVESAFNARLVNVLGAMSIDQTHVAAVSGLELWGRVLSSAALGLALITAYVVQSQKRQVPQPLGLLFVILHRKERQEAWGIGRWSFALTIVAVCMFTLFHGEKRWVENRATTVGADSRWWMFYAVRAVDALLISANQLEARIRNEHQPAKQAESRPVADPGVKKESSLIPETSRFPKFEDVYLRDPARFKLSRFTSADWSVWIAIAPHALQNFAKTQRMDWSQQKPMTPRDIQRRIEDALAKNADALAAPLMEMAVLNPVQQCLDVLYDQSAFRTRPLNFDPARCVTHAAALEQIKSSYPVLSAAIPERCLLMDGERRKYADFAVFHCALLESDTNFRVVAQIATDSYLAAFERQRAQIIATYKAAPRTLPKPIAAGIVSNLDIALARNPDLRATVAFEDVAIGEPERLPPCGQLSKQLLMRFRLARESADDLVESRLARWLRALEESYCNSIDALIPGAPGDGVDISLFEPRLEALRNAAQISIDTTLESAGINRRIYLPKDWRIPTAANHAEWIRRELIAPLRGAIDEIIGEQLNASLSARPLLPDPITVTGREEFEHNPVVSNLFKLQIQNLTDGAFGCLGVTNLSGRVKVDDDLAQLMSPAGTTAFNERVGNLLFENILRTRLTGTVDDFETGGRCGLAGVTAYHRGYLPGFALLISMLGLIYHCRKAVLYVLRFARMPSMIRQVTAFAFVSLLLGWPLLKSVDALSVRETDILVQRYAASHGPTFEFGVRWLIKAQALYHPATEAVYRTAFEPFGINFTREIEPDSLELQNTFDQSCGLVPQIRQTPEYQILRTVITHRDLCVSGVPSRDRIAGR